LFSYTPPTEDGSSSTGEGQSGSAHNERPGGHRRQGFTPLPNAVLLDARLSRDARLLYALLQYHARGDGRCFPSHATLAAELGGGETALRAYLRELIDAGLVGQRRRGQGRTNMYVLLPGGAGQQHPPRPKTAEPEDPEGDGRAAPEPRQTEVLVPAQAEGQVAGTSEVGGPEAPESDALERAEGAAYEERREGDQEIGNSRIRMLHGGSDEAAGTPARDQAAESRTVLPARPDPRQDTWHRALAGPVAELCQEFGDQAPPQASLARARNLFIRSGQDPDGFLALLDEARATTLASRGRITKRPVGEGATGRRNMVPYCFAVLERLVDAEQHPEGRATTAPPPRTPDEECTQAGCGDSGRSGEEARPTSEAEALWRAVLDGMREVLTPGNFARCQAGRAAVCEGDVLQIVLGTEMERHWFDTRIRRLLDESLARCGPAGMRLQFAVGTF